MPEFLVFVFEWNLDHFAVLFDDEDSGIEVFGFYGEGVAGVAVASFSDLWIVGFDFVGFGVFKF